MRSFGRPWAPAALVVIIIALSATQPGCGRFGFDRVASMDGGASDAMWPFPDAGGLSDAGQCTLDPECDDSDLCNGVETCNLGMLVCVNPPDEPDGSACPGGTCINGVCEAPTCTDGWQNGDETGVDCGGSMCVACSCSSPSLGPSGTRTHPVGSFEDISRAVAIQSDGKIVAAGYSRFGSSYDFVAVRYTDAGVLDTSFDGDGMAITPIVGDSSAWSVALQLDGKIVVAGYTRNGADDDFAVVRYNTNGSLDGSFDGDGIVTTAVGAGNDRGQSVAIQLDGKIVVAGYARIGGVDELVVVRYNTDGSLDTSFDGDGKVTTAVLGGAIAQGVAIQSDNKIVVGGYADNGSNDDFAVVRYNTNGSLDGSFDGDGIVTTAVGAQDDQGRSIAIQADGKIVMAGETANGGVNHIAVVRYDGDGNLDASFDGDGIAVTPVLVASVAWSVVIQSDNKLVVAGHAWNGSNDDFAVLRYNTNGSLDSSFDGDGIVTTAVSASDFVYGAAVQCDSKIVVVGRSGSNIDFTLARYRSDGSLDGP